MRRHLHQVQFQLHVILESYGDVESEVDKMRISKCIFLLQIFYANVPPVLTGMQNTSVQAWKIHQKASLIFSHQKQPSSNTA